jgi:uncharacterized protein (TIGR02145 family)
MNKFKITLLTASLALAMAFTFSCSSDDGDGGGGGGGCNIGNDKAKKIGSQTWMTENLNCDVGVSKCYDDDPASCAKYGRLYDWETAMTVCPSGWRLPSAADWDILMTYVQTDNGETYTNGSDASVAGKYLKATNGWNDNNNGQSGNGEDKYGFAALPGGYGVSFISVYHDAGKYGNWWSSTEYGSGYAYRRDMRYYDKRAYWDDNDKDYMYSVRCVKTKQ